MIKKTITIILVYWLGIYFANADDGSTAIVNDTAANASIQTRESRIGVLAFRGSEQAHKMWGPTAEYLSSTVPGFRFTIMPLTLDNINQVVESGEVDFVLTNSASYAGLEAIYGVTRIATLRNKRSGGYYTRFGALILARSDRDDIRTLDDLKDKTFMAVHKNAFGGWWMAWREFLNAGINPDEDLKQVIFAGFPQDRIIRAVEQGKVDAGTVRTDVLERMARSGKIDIKDFKVLNARQSEKFPFALSTVLYPEWPFAIVKHTSPVLAQKVAVALLNMGQESAPAIAANSGGWTVPLDYQPVHDLMKQLKVGPYVHLGEVSVANVFREYWQWIVVMAVFLLFLSGLVFYMLRLNKKLKQSQQQSLSQEKRIRALYDVASIAGLSFEDQITEVLKTGCALLGTEIGRLCQINEQEQLNIILNVVAPESFNIKAGVRLPLEKTFCNVTFTKDCGVSVDHAGSSEWKDSPCYEFSHLEAYIATPVIVNGEKFGTINYSSPHPRKVPFMETDMDLVRLMSRNVSVILERQRAQEQILYSKIMAEEASNAKSAFLANMSHEIRTPLTSIIGFGESLLDSKQSLDQRVGSVKTIIRSGKHLLQLINDILDLSKVEARKLEIEKVSISLMQIISEVDSLIRMQAKDHRLDFNITYHFPLPTNIVTEPLRLKQVLLNLCSNAIKFTESGSVELSVSCDFENEKIYFSVCDTGIGLTSQQIEKIFDPFTQADSTTTRKYGGTGLGLSLSRQLVELLGGKLDVKSTIGEGSTFSFDVSTGPLENVQQILSKHETLGNLSLRHEFESAGEIAGSILLAEDNSDNQVLISMYLRSMGIEVVIVSNGEEAVKEASEREFDLILMDMQMPVMDGLDAVMRLRKDGYTGAVATLTANAMKEDRDRCLQAGCDDFITKPIDRKELGVVVRKYLGGVANKADDETSAKEAEGTIEPIVSLMIEEDPDFYPVLKSFVLNLETTVSKVQAFCVENNWEELKSLVHQIKGLGGGYGYPMLTELAARIEFQVLSEDYAQIENLVKDLLAMHKAILAGFDAGASEVRTA